MSRSLAALLVPAITSFLELRRTSRCPEDAPEVLPGAVRCTVRGDEDLKASSTVVHLDRPYRDRFLPLLIHFWGLLYDRDWRRLCKLFNAHPDLVFFDVGANYGAFTLPMAQCRGVWRVVAVEASPVHVALLEASLKANDARHVLLYPFAVSSVPGSMLNFTSEVRNQGRNSAVAGASSNKLGGETFSSPVTTIDEIYRELPTVMRRVLVMKMDIEGFEGWALQGARRFLREAPPCYCKMEFDEDLLERAGTPAVDILEFMASVGYVATNEPREVFGIPPDIYFEQVNVTACVEAKSRLAEEDRRTELAWL